VAVPGERSGRQTGNREEIIPSEETTDREQNNVYLRASGGDNPVNDDLRRHLFSFSYNDVTQLRRKMSKARQQEDREEERELDRFAVHLIV